MKLTRDWYAAYDPGVPYEIDIPHIPLHLPLELAAQRYARRTALVFYECAMSYRDLLGQVNAFACVLQERGLQAGDRVMLSLPNIPQAVICFYGAIKAGGIAVLSDPLAEPHDVMARLRDCRPAFVVTVRPLLPTLLNANAGCCLILTRVRDYLPRLRGALVSLFDQKGALEALRHPDVLRLGELLRTFRGRVPRTVDCGDVAVLAYTSGTVGPSRAVMLTHQNLVANTLQVRALLTNEVREGQEVLLAAVPFWHSYGLTCLNLSMALAGSLILVPRFRAHQTLRLIAKHRPTLFPGVPAMYMALCNHPLVRRYPMGSIRACISGAAPLAIEVREAFERLTRGRLVEGYGLTEAGPVTHANPLGGKGKPASIGVPLPSTDARIVDAVTGQELPVGQIGELAVRGPQVMKGYWGRDEDTQAVLRDGWLHTGDLATVDADGFFQVICRKQEVIRVGDRDVYPRDVEEVLFEHPAVRDAAVVGVLMEGRVLLRAHVVLRYGERGNAQDIIDFCCGRLSPWKVPSLIKFERRLPRSGAGKLLRRLL